MSGDLDLQLRRERPGDPVVFPAPSPEAAAELRRLLPPVRVERRAS